MQLNSNLFFFFKVAWIYNYIGSYFIIFNTYWRIFQTFSFAYFHHIYYIFSTFNSDLYINLYYYYYLSNNNNNQLLHFSYFWIFFFTFIFYILSNCLDWIFLNDYHVICVTNKIIMYVVVMVYLYRLYHIILKSCNII